MKIDNNEQQKLRRMYQDDSITTGRESETAIVQFFIALSQSSGFFPRFVFITSYSNSLTFFMVLLGGLIEII